MNNKLVCRFAVSPSASVFRVLTKVLVLLLCLGGVLQPVPGYAQAPAAPSGLTAEHGGNGGVLLRWTNTIFSTSTDYGYKIYRSSNMGGPYSQIATALAGPWPGSALGYADVSAATGINYYVVRTYTPSGTSGNSNEASAWGPPAIPQNFVATPGNTTVTLTWDPVPSATAYKIQRSTSPSSGFDVKATVSTTSWTDTGRANGTTYYYRIRAVNGYGDGELTAVKSATPSANTAPVANNDSSVAYTTNEDTPLIISAPGVLGNDTDAQGNTLTAVKVTNPTNGTVTLNANGSFTYTPNPNFPGPSDYFTYKA